VPARLALGNHPGWTRRSCSHRGGACRSREFCRVYVSRLLTAQARHEVHCVVFPVVRRNGGRTPAALRWPCAVTSAAAERVDGPRARRPCRAARARPSRPRRSRHRGSRIPRSSWRCSRPREEIGRQNPGSLRGVQIKPGAVLTTRVVVGVMLRSYACAIRSNARADARLVAGDRRTVGCRNRRRGRLVAVDPQEALHLLLSGAPGVGGWARQQATGLGTWGGNRADREGGCDQPAA
jgi:hypothetical protein